MNDKDGKQGSKEAKLFVGREIEKRQFKSRLAQAQFNKHLWLWGLGGIGKTSLLNEFREICLEKGIKFVSVEGHNELNPIDILDALNKGLEVFSVRPHWTNIAGN